jgi:hypothetical protein
VTLTTIPKQERGKINATAIEERLHFHVVVIIPYQTSLPDPFRHSEVDQMFFLSSAGSRNW